MNDPIFERCHIQYETVLRLIRSISAQVLGPYLCEDRMAELEGEGWVIALEALRQFDPSRGAQASTYLWLQLNSRLRRYHAAALNHGMHTVHHERMCEVFSTDGVPQSGVFDGNPWAMAPDVMYEKKERLTFWKRIKENNASGVQCCLSCMSGSPAERALAYRRRKRYMDKMQANYQMMITRQESES